MAPSGLEDNDVSVLGEKNELLGGYSSPGSRLVPLPRTLIRRLLRVLNCHGVHVRIQRDAARGLNHLAPPISGARDGDFPRTILANTLQLSEHLCPQLHHGV